MRSISLHLPDLDDRITGFLARATRGQRDGNPSDESNADPPKAISQSSRRIQIEHGYQLSGRTGVLVRQVRNVAVPFLRTEPAAGDSAGTFRYMIT